MTPPPTRERRSPAAAAHDPPVTKHEWTEECDLPLDAFIQAAGLRAALDAAGLDRVVRHGGIHVDRRRLELDRDPPAKVQAGARVALYAFEVEPAPLALPQGAVILDEDGVVAACKPPYFTVQGTRASRLCSLERALRLATGHADLVPAHRLDRETSGLVLFVTGRRAASLVGRQFLARAVRKDYLAVVHPSPAEPRFTVEGRMVRAPHASHSLFALLPPGAGAGQPSRTRFVVEAARGERSLVRCEPETGRTHQIRVHLASVGSPIAGDSLYGTGWLPGHPASAERLLLHARSLEIRLASGGPVRRLEAPVPPDVAP